MQGAGSVDLLALRGHRPTSGLYFGYIIPLMNIPTWHYKVQDIAVGDVPDARALHDVTMILDGLGIQGWEAVTSVVGSRPGHVFVLFKRQGPESVQIAA